MALVRLEQRSPFPHAALARRLARYPNAELVWCQEQPKNMGYWAFAQPRINTAVREILEVEVGRRAHVFGGDDDGDDDGDGGGGNETNEVLGRTEGGFFFVVRDRERRGSKGAIRGAARGGVARDGFARDSRYRDQGAGARGAGVGARRDPTAEPRSSVPRY